jgi:hypothetical protein
MANILTTLIAVGLCLVNALVWAFISEMPVVGMLWVGAAAFCLRIHRWARG